MGNTAPRHRRARRLDARRVRLLALVVAALVALAALPRAASAQDPWLLLGLARSLGPLELSGLGFSLGDLDLRGGLVEMRLRATPWLSMAPGYMRTRRRTGDGDVEEHRARVDATYHATVRRLHVAGRLLVERRWYRLDVHDGPHRRSSATLLRARMRTDLVLRPRAAVVPFATVEPFHDLGAMRHTRTWLSAGLSIGRGDLRVESYYLRRFERSGPDGGALALAALLRL